MLDLLNAYSGKEIAVFICLLAIALKEVIELFKYFKKEGYALYQKANEDNEQNLQIQGNSQKLDLILEKVNNLQEKIDVLEQSDKDGIKTWIVYRYKEILKDPKQLDSMGMDLLEKRFKHYQAEGGNSYIEDLMTTIREIYKKEGES